MDKETALQAWKRLRSEIDADNWLFVGTISPEMVDRAIEALEGKDIDVTSKLDAIPVDYLNSRISRLRQYKTYAGDFGADLLEAIIKDYNKEAHND